MKLPEDIALIVTNREKCRTCYTCVRECPAKAIRIFEGQAEVYHERCIGCGNCVKVCSQGAKQVVSSVETVSAILDSGATVAAAIAPAFPAEFSDYNANELAGWIKSMGFHFVHEVGFGADIIARSTREILEKDPQAQWISTSCPAIVRFIEYYHPDLVPSLLPLVSPMIASAQALHQQHGPNLKIVFIGPCLAKKGEAMLSTAEGHIDAALTFAELRDLAELRNKKNAPIPTAEFDGPKAELGAIFPLSRGLVQAAGMSENLVSGCVVSADGRQDFPEAILEFESGDLNASLLDILCCNGCIMGVGMTTDEPMFRRRARISRYASEGHTDEQKKLWQEAMADSKKLPLSKNFVARDRRMKVPQASDISSIMAKMGKHQPSDELNCRACGYETCRQHACAIFDGMAENEMCLPYVIEQLGNTVQDLNQSHTELASTQDQLMHSERLASMGQLAAGIAHEVNNPLGVVTLYSNILLEECDSNSSLREELTLIADQAERCKTIVAGLLDFSRQNKVELGSVNLEELVANTLRGIIIPSNIILSTAHAGPHPTAEIDPNQLGQVLSNLIYNAIAAMPQGGTLEVITRTENHNDLTIVVADTGSGIAQENLKKIFEPFFTTKSRGKGTGLGLAVSYGIVKMHRGDLRVISNTNPDVGPTGSTFTITLPRCHDDSTADHEGAS